MGGSYDIQKSDKVGAVGMCEATTILGDLSTSQAGVAYLDLPLVVAGSTRQDILCACQAQRVGSLCCGGASGMHKG